MIKYFWILYQSGSYFMLYGEKVYIQENHLNFRWYAIIAIFNVDFAAHGINLNPLENIRGHCTRSWVVEVHYVSNNVRCGRSSWEYSLKVLVIRIRLDVCVTFEI